MSAIALKSQDRRSSLTSRRSQRPIHFCVEGKQFLSRECSAIWAIGAAKHAPLRPGAGKRHKALRARLEDELKLKFNGVDRLRTYISFTHQRSNEKLDYGLSGLQAQRYCVRQA
jgi:hypothetical protein